MKIEVDISDLQKIEAVLHEAYMHHLHRDESNARLHLAKKVVQSALTSALAKAWERTDNLIKGDRIAVIEE